MSVTLDVDDEPTPGLDADGRPDPVYAARLGLVPASAGRRSAAFALDAAAWAVLAIPGVIGLPLLVAAFVDAAGDTASIALDAVALPLVLVGVSQVLLAIFGLVQLILHGRRGFTLGKKALGIRSVGVATFAPAGFWRITLRALVLWASQSFVPIVGPVLVFVSSQWDPEARGRSWLDRIGGCYALDIRRGLNPLDPKALRHARREVDRPAAAASRTLPSLATDRAPDEHTFIPAARSSSGVVAAGLGDWEPPELGAARAPTSPAPPAPVVASEPPATPAVGFVMRFDDGTAVPATGRGLLGRAPAASQGEAPALLVPLSDESMRISKTHAEFGIASGRFWLTDRSSKNGTVVELPGGGTRTLVPGDRVELPVGTTVRLGGRRFTVERSTIG